MLPAVLALTCTYQNFKNFRTWAKIFYTIRWNSTKGWKSHTAETETEFHTFVTESDSVSVTNVWNSVSAACDFQP